MASRLAVELDPDHGVLAEVGVRDVVARVELTYFGRHPAVLADYTACRESFNALARSLYGSAPA